MRRAMMPVRARRSKRADGGRTTGQRARPFTSCVVRSLALTGWVAVLTAACIVVPGCHGPAAVPPNGTAPARSVLSDPSKAFWTTRAPSRFFVRIETTKGDFVIVLQRGRAPRGVDRLYQLVRAG